MSGSLVTKVSLSQPQSRVIITSPPVTAVKTSPTYTPLPQQLFIKSAGDVVPNLNFTNGYVLTWNAFRNAFDLEPSGGASILNGNTSEQIFFNSNPTANATTNTNISLPTANANALYMFKGQVGARDIHNNNSKVWSVEGGLKTGAGNTMNYIGTPIINIIAGDNGTNNWIMNLLIDAPNANMIINGSGSTNTINWVSRIDITEIG